jgi:hypothetical protein
MFRFVTDFLNALRGKTSFRSSNSGFFAHSVPVHIERRGEKIPLDPMRQQALHGARNAWMEQQRAVAIRAQRDGRVYLCKE